MNTPYQPDQIEAKWQSYWQQHEIFRAEERSQKAKFYCLDFFPYPSGDGLHVGHCRNYVPTDVISRYKRMQGFNVLHPMGWDAFGEPAEQYAISHGVHPRETTLKNTQNFKRQMQLIGAGIDWSREINSSDPEYYHWTQWFFLLLYRRGLAYRDTNWQWWCPTCQTTLSSHEVSNGVCWRGHSGVTRRKIPAWYFRITAYADALLSGLDEIDWPEPIKAMQRSWIGRSEGCQIEFSTTAGVSIPVFTTRPDTIFGVTYIALAPEHSLLSSLVARDNQSQVDAYIQSALQKSEVERMAEDRRKTGVFTGCVAQHPLTGAAIPVWVADYVLPTVGTGAVMGVPGHDQRDFKFARVYHLPCVYVISPENADQPASEGAYTGPGVLVHSGGFNGLRQDVAAQRICDRLEQIGSGRRSVQYHMRDWLISRQHYWGAPIPIVYCSSCGEVPVPEDQLPVVLPEMQDFKPDGTGRSPLARNSEFVHTSCPQCDGPAERETDTMGGFACSSWYFLRFASPHYSDGPFDPQSVQYWLPVDLYVGGAEHATLHLLYARFWTHVMADAGLTPFREPFQKLLNQGQLMGLDGVRMSKSRGNVITPDQMVAEYGADALRVYEMFMAPFDQDVNWSTSGINGARRFLNRVWKLVLSTWNGSAGAATTDEELERNLHQTIQLVTERIEQFRFNTMVSGLMEFVKFLADRKRRGAWRTQTFHESLETLMVLMAPAAPHIVEELWQATGHRGSIQRQAWPVWNRSLTSDPFIQIAVQVDGKVRQVLDGRRGMSEQDVLALARMNPKIQSILENRELLRVYNVPDKVINLVTTARMER